MSKSKAKVLVVGGSNYYYTPFTSLGDCTEDLDLLDSPEEISLVIFTGGEDIDPNLYGHNTFHLTKFNPIRDEFELKVFEKTTKHKLPMIGICRGAQFLCAMAGGTLYQHVNNHLSPHTITLWDDRELMVSSTHHQMQCPPEDAVILGWADPRKSNIYFGGDGELDPPEVEPEIVYYKNINAIGIQYHPEMMKRSSLGFSLPLKLFDTFLKSA